MRIRTLFTKSLLSLSVAVFAISIDQAAAQLSPALQVADSDSDGKVTTEELKTFLAARYLDVWVERIDANQNGKISKWEIKLARKAFLQLLEEEEKQVEAAVAAAKKRPTSVDMMNQRFMGRKPVVGSTIDSLVAFDEAGNEVNFKDFRGKHVVIVFGCLT